VNHSTAKRHQGDRDGGDGDAAQPADGQKVTPRSHANVTWFFEGLELVEPGIV
jgi:hypothetical protein